VNENNCSTAAAHTPCDPAARFHLHDGIMSDALSSLADEKFVSLTTWKKNGEKVASAMWLARDGDALVMWTPADSWKVKRLRRDNRVELTPCGRTGQVDGGAKTTAGTAIVDDDRRRPHASRSSSRPSTASSST
jgi:PPOX class probable F420-dependent enzyme